MTGTRYLHFGAYRLDRVEGRLWRDATAIRLNRKAFGLLTFLAEHAGQLVTKQALLAAVWPRSVVVEAVLTTAVREVRRALDDRTRQPAFVETVHGSGISIHRSGHRARQFAGAGQHMRNGWSDARRNGKDSGNDSRPLSPACARWCFWRANRASARRRSSMHSSRNSPPSPTSTCCADSASNTTEPVKPIYQYWKRSAGSGAGAEGAELTRLLGRYAPSWLPHLPSMGPEAERVNVAAAQTTPLCMLRELTEALDQLAAHRPVVFVLEDLHWSDTATLDWLAYVARRRDPARLLVLATYRPVDVIVQTHPLHTVVGELHAQSLGTRCMLDYLSSDAVVRHVQLRFVGSA